MKLIKGTCYEYMPLEQFTTYKIGGKARLLYVPKNKEDLALFLKQTPLNLPVICLGLGSNILLYDGIIEAVFVLFRQTFKYYDIDQNHQTMTVGCGISCPTVARKAQKHGYNNLNFLAGIPGTIGGALRMNAGAFRGEIWPEVISVSIMNRQGEIYHKMSDQFDFSYRLLENLQPDEYFLEATLKLNNNPAMTNPTIDELLNQRKESQPILYKSCGSVFKNPKGDFAARLIEACGLKNHTIGDAYVSSKHANFIINKGNATFQNVMDLVHYIKDKVQHKFDTKLESEVKIIGANGEYQSIW